MNAILAPSLLSANFAALGEECLAFEKAAITWLHLDVMDGNFVPNISFGIPVISALRKITGLYFDVHLMIANPEIHIDRIIEAGADLVVPHLEAMVHPHRVLCQIREKGAKAGIALNPSTDPAQLRWLLPDLDFILLMGVNPGYSGQKFIPQTIKKIRDCRAFLEQEGYAKIPLEVDGGARPENAAELAAAGANVLVAGSAFFCGDDYAATHASFARAINTVKPDSAVCAASEIVRQWKRRK